MRVSSIIIAACLVASRGFAQPNEQRFDVSVIKPLGLKGGPAPVSGTPYLPGGRFRDPGVTIRVLIEMAYDIEDLGLKIVGLPKWAEAEGYSIEAAAGRDYPADVSQKQNEANVKAMLRSLLADRFQLKLHREEREAQVLVLRAPKGDAKLRAMPAPSHLRKEGEVGAAWSDRIIRFGGKEIELAQLVPIFSLMLKERIVDKTGLTGRYDFEIDWRSPEPGRSSSFGPEGKAQLLAILKEDLGFEMKSEKAPVEFWVVDRVAMPDEN